MGGKPPLGGRPDGRPGAQDSAARLSPDSGQGSDPTGSDTSNFSDQEKALRGGGGGAGGAEYVPQVLGGGPHRGGEEWLPLPGGGRQAGQACHRLYR